MSRAPLGRRKFWTFLLGCAVFYALAVLAGHKLGWPLGPIAGLLFLWPLTRAGQQRLQNTGGDPVLMWAFSAPFGFVQLVKLMSTVAPGHMRPITESSFAVVSFCHLASLAAAMILAHYWIRPDRGVQT